MNGWGNKEVPRLVMGMMGVKRDLTELPRVRPIELQERSSIRMEPEAFSALESSREFRQLLEAGILSVTFRREWIELYASDYVGFARLVGGQVLHITEKVPGSLNALAKAADRGAFAFVEASSDYPHVEDLDTPQWLQLRTWAAFLGAIADYVRKGIVRAYAEQISTSSPRGKIQFSPTLKLISRGSRTKVVCKTSALSYDLPLNRILKLALRHIAVRSRVSPELAAKSALMLSAFTPVGLDYSYYSDRMLGRLSGDISDDTRLLTRLAVAVLRDVNLATATGGVIELPFASFLRLWDLFEEAVVTAFGRAVRGGSGGWQVTRKAAPLGPRYLFSADMFMKAEPDVVLSKGERPFLVVDAKYKKLSLGSSHDDVYQILAHARAYEVREAWLISLQETVGGSEFGSAKTEDGITLRWLSENPSGMEDRLINRIHNFTGTLRAELNRLT
jgi:hypothetical protein